MHTKVFCLFDYFKIIVAKFQIQVFILTFETVPFLLGGDKHGMGCRNIQGKLVALLWRAGAHSARGAKCENGAPLLVVAQDMLKIFPL